MALIVETGRGVPGAESYNSIGELDVYMLKYGHSGWPVPERKENGSTGGETSSPGVTPENGETTLTGPIPRDIEGDTPSVPSTPLEPAENSDPNLAEKEAVARMAAIYIDSRYGTRFTGTPSSADQGLMWPRKDAVDYFGNEIADNALPKEIKRAHAEVSFLVYTGVQLTPNVDAGPLLTRKKIDVLEWEWDSETYANSPVFGWVDSLLFSLLGPAEEVGAMDIMGIQRA